MSQITDPQLVLYQQVVEGLSHWKPHPGQVKAGRALFTHNIRNIFIQCGRKWGKTELSLYILWRWGMTNPGQGMFYVAPELKQGKRIVWEDPRLENFGPRHWIKDISQADTRIDLINGSYLKLEGSENFEAHRGTRPGLVVYEEYKDHDPRFRNIMRPNLSVYNAPEIFVGTPPDKECEFIEVAEEHKNSPKHFFHQAPTWENPLIDRQWLREEKARLYKRNEGDVWEREYAAKYIKGGASKIFPMLPEVVPHEVILQRIERDKKKLLWIHWTDPGSASCFASLFCAVNPYTKEVFWLDEIYEKNQQLMSVGQVGPRIIKKRDDLYPREWRQGYDEAATWFYNEMLNQFDEAFEPSHKHLHDKSDGLSLMKDVMLQGKWIMSDRCTMLWWEMDNYYKDSKGNIPKKNDHQIDNARYILGALNYTLQNEEVPDTDKRENFRGARPEDDFPELNNSGTNQDDLSDNEEVRLWKS